MSDLKYIENAAQLLLDKGLLFEINRTILHPLGFAMQIEVDDDGKAIGISNSLWDCTGDEEGILYDDKAFQTGSTKFKKYMDEEGFKRIAKRVNKLGYSIQGK